MAQGEAAKQAMIAAGMFDLENIQKNKTKSKVVVTRKRDLNKEKKR